MSSFIHPSYRLYGPWALVTGSSAGIGEAFARELARRGFNLLLLARRKARLETLAATLVRDHGVRCRTLECDLTCDTQVQSLLDQVSGLDLGLLINNAGASSHHGRFIERSWPEVESLIDFNTRVQLRLLHHFARQFAQRGRGGIIQVASIAGHMSVPYMLEYSACKALQLAAGEALSYELAPCGVDVLVLSPGATRSERLAYGMEPEQVVTEGLDALGRRSCIVSGWRNRLSALHFRYFNTRHRALARMGRFQAGQLKHDAGD